MLQHNIYPLNHIPKNTIKIAYSRSNIPIGKSLIHILLPSPIWWVENLLHSCHQLPRGPQHQHRGKRPQQKELETAQNDVWRWRLTGFAGHHSEWHDHPREPADCPIKSLMPSQLSSSLKSISWTSEMGFSQMYYNYQMKAYVPWAPGWPP